MWYEKSESLELGKAEDLVLVIIGQSVEENPPQINHTTTPPAAYISEYDNEE
jgi:hypothetical protein